VLDQPLDKRSKFFESVDRNWNSKTNCHHRNSFQAISETDKQIVMTLADAFEFETNRHYSPFIKTSHRAKTKSHGTIAAEYL
jgi:hypothetical protein